SAGPWVAINCAAVPVELIESELFGHVKGAFTTANSSRHGLVREAEGGTLFLDDIDCLPLLAQGKLLRFLQQQEYRPVGSNTVCRSNVRVVASSNRDLRALASRNAFRQDLYFRLNVLPVSLPPLRERREDIAALAVHFIELFGRSPGPDTPQRPRRRLSPEAMLKLVDHDWPGNVRELRHVIERSLLLSDRHEISAGDIDIDGGAGMEGADGPEGASIAAESFRAAKKRFVDRFERRYIETLLSIHNGNITHAARAAK